MKTKKVKKLEDMNHRLNKTVLPKLREELKALALSCNHFKNMFELER